MTNVLFFIEDNWAFGAIHKALCKRLAPYDINADILSWSKSYTLDEFAFIVKRYDYILTSPESVVALLTYNVPLEKMVIVAHGSESLHRAVNLLGTKVFNSFHNYAVVNPALDLLGKKLEIERIPLFVKIGIDSKFFDIPLSKGLTKIGYAGTTKHILKDGQDCKRVHLAYKLSEVTGVPLITPKSKMPHICMPFYYSQFDALLITSTEETACLPMMEACAAGRLVLSTKVGYFNENANELCEMAENNYLDDAVKYLNFYKNTKEYTDRCGYVRQYALDNYDWEHSIKQWVNLFV